MQAQTSIQHQLTNTITHGDCIQVMREMPANSVDFILTGSPYLVNYRDRDRRTIQNDTNADWLKPAMREAYRVLKQDRVAIMFYGWTKIDVFFDAWKTAGSVYLKHSPSASGFLKNPPVANGVPLHVMAVDYRPAQRMPASFSSFRIEVGRKGFDHVSEIYEATRKEQPPFALAPDTVTAWAYELLADGHIAEALDIMKLAIQLKPSSRNYASLGETYNDAGQKTLAVESYRKALELNPNELAAKQGLEQMQRAASLRN